MEDACQELIQFMQLSTRLELKLTATKNVLALTGSPEGRKFITDNQILLEVRSNTKIAWPICWYCALSTDIKISTQMNL